MGVRPDRTYGVVRETAISGAASELQARTEGADRRAGQLDLRAFHKPRDFDASMINRRTP